MTEENKREWIRIEEFCDRHGQRRNTVQKRVHDNIWQRGLHYSCPEGGKAYLHEARCLAWLKENGKLEA